jgi:hypothetical protein
MQLSGLKKLLQNHFRLEEEGGYLFPITEQQPHLDKEVKLLSAEHGELLESLCQILGLAQAAKTQIEALKERIENWADSNSQP